MKFRLFPVETAIFHLNKLLTNILAICPTTEPTAPAALLTNTVSPALAWPISTNPM